MCVCIEFPAREALLEKQPDTYYMTSHYRGYATVLVRLAKISHSELRNLLEQAAQFVGAQTKKAPKKTAKKTSRRAGRRESRRS